VISGFLNIAKKAMKQSLLEKDYDYDDHET